MVIPGGADRFVTYDRWDAEHQRLRDQISVINNRLDDLEDEDEKRAARRWTLLLAGLTGLVLPLIVATIVTLFIATH